MTRVYRVLLFNRADEVVYNDNHRAGTKHAAIRVATQTYKAVAGLERQDIYRTSTRYVPPHQRYS